ncbi:NADP-dependent malic enzyme [Erysipelothrix sp. HDW6A]|uniref:NAD(P)-dependent malic enzyme n=1 Tax=Erysipelothrix sp. HDW6A TaxID=2714928 RepID=UPI00140DA565|nr:NADP-dependent malic enzyme [Erysipelothrix sp. HDW6A]QIK57857.1 NADP-dependent malic enzyme [Erysipelothrix sp. HDW6A]
MSIYERSLSLHKDLEGKISTELKTGINSLEDLSLVYSPGVAAPCLEISKEKSKVYDYTWKGNTIAVVSDGSAVLGLGNIGAEASLPVMEGKAALFKRFAGINAVPIVLDTQDTQEIINIVKAIAPGFGGINLEDISSPRCVEIERALESTLDIPIFHDDQHGTAIIVLAGLINSLKHVNKEASEVKCVISGVGAAGSAIIKLLNEYGVKHITAFNSKGVIKPSVTYNDSVLDDIKNYTNMNDEDIRLDEALVNADVFIGVSVANILTEAMVSSMNSGSIVFALANPDPEIDYDLAKQAGASIVATGRSDYPNQINNVLVFPGLFKGLLSSGAKNVPSSIMVKAAHAIAQEVEEIHSENIVPNVFNPDVADAISREVIDEVEKLRRRGIDI